MMLMMKLCYFIVQPCFSTWNKLISILQFRCHYVCYKVNARLLSIIRCRYCHHQYMITILDINQRSHSAATRSMWGLHQFLTALQLSINQSQIIKFWWFYHIKKFQMSLINLSMSDYQGWLNTLISIYLYPTGKYWLDPHQHFKCMNISFILHRNQFCQSIHYILYVCTHISAFFCVLISRN